MRIWDIHPSILCRKHLLGEHRELHGIWSILTKNKIGYSQHPETKRWSGKLKALYVRHELLVGEMINRGYKHSSPLNDRLAIGKNIQDIFLQSIKEQLIILASKNCDCKANSTP